MSLFDRIGNLGKGMSKVAARNVKDSVGDARRVVGDAMRDAADTIDRSRGLFDRRVH